MPRLHPPLALLLLALARPVAAAPVAAPTGSTSRPAPAAASSQLAPEPPAIPDARLVTVLHLSVGTGVCAAASSEVSQDGNPCWLQLGVAPALRLGRLEFGLVYEGRELVKLITFGLVQPPSATVLGATAGWVHEASERWRLQLAGEAGWRRYADFAGSGVSDRKGVADTSFVGLTGRAALGLRPESGRADRLEASVSVRSDLETAHATVDGVPWSVGGWSFTMGIGLVSEW